MGRVAQVSTDLVSSGSQGAPFAITQYGYDNANDLQCGTIRMNMAVAGSLPTACSLGRRPTGWTEALAWTCRSEARSSNAV